MSISSCTSSSKALTDTKEVIASSRGMGSNCTIGVPLAVRLEIGTR